MSAEALCDAIAANDLEQVRNLVEEQHASVEATSNYCNGTALHQACENGDRSIAIVQYLIKCGANVEARGGNVACTPLHFAIGGGNDCVEVIRCLVEQGGANVDATDEEGETPLHMACDLNKLEIVRVLIETYGASVAAVNNEGQTVLHKLCDNAISSPNLELVRLVAGARPANIDAVDNVDLGWTALQYAYRRNAWDHVQCLLEIGGANVDMTDEDGETVLHYASYKGNLAIVQFLVERFRASVEPPQGASTSLQSACRGEHPTVVLYLTEVGRANVETRDAEGWTALHEACNYKNLEIIQCLVATCGSNVEAVTGRGLTPLHMACRNGHLEVVRYLVETGNAAVNMSNTLDCNRSAVHYACWTRSIDVVQYLVDSCGANIHATLADGSTALHVASNLSYCPNGDLGMLRYLVETGGIKVSTTNHDGETALHRPSLERKLRMVLCLVQLWEDTDIDDNKRMRVE